jgi:hypothetical protein
MKVILWLNQHEVTRLHKLFAVFLTSVSAPANLMVLTATSPDNVVTIVPEFCIGTLNKEHTIRSRRMIIEIRS